MPAPIGTLPEAIPSVLPAPVGGLNFRDSLANMPVTDALRLDNHFCAIGKVILRTGTANHITAGIGSGAVDTLAEYHDGANRKLIAGANGLIYDATSSAATGLASGFSENRWQTAQFDAKLGLVNGTDAPQQFSGTAISAMTINDAASASGLAKTNIIGIFIHESRSYLWEDGQSDFWYSALNTLGGTMTKFALSRVGDIKGNLICANTWNVAGGAATWGGGGVGVDLAVFVMSSGQAVVYEGDDPGSDWSLVGVYQIGAPVDVRGTLRIGGDLVILTKAGLVSMTAVLQQKGLIGPQGTITNKIDPKLIKEINDNIAQTGWEAMYFPEHQAGELLLINDPASATAMTQWVLNVETGAWARWKGLSARCWARFNDRLYFGTATGTIIQADTGNTDLGAAIAGDAETAYSYFGEPAKLKTGVELMPTFKSSGAIAASIVMQFDFQTVGVAPSLQTFQSAYQFWENIDELWDESDIIWEVETTTAVTKRVGAAGEGFAVGARLRTSMTSDFEWHATNFGLIPGMGVP